MMIKNKRTDVEKNFFTYIKITTKDMMVSFVVVLCLFQFGGPLYSRRGVWPFHLSVPTGPFSYTSSMSTVL